MVGHVKRKDEGLVLRRMLDAPVPGKRRKGRQKTRWRNLCKRDGKCRTGQNKVEELYSIPFRRPQIMGEKTKKDRQRRGSAGLILRL